MIMKAVVRLVHFVNGTALNEEDSCRRTTDTCTDIQYNSIIGNVYYYREVYFRGGFSRCLYICTFGIYHCFKMHRS